MYTIQTDRLGLRNWRPSDFELFAEMNADEEVLRYFPRTFTKEESIAGARRYMAHFAKHGYTYFAADTRSDGQFIGFIGLLYQTYESHFTPCTDIGWRLRKTAWGKGYATEGAKACLQFGFEKMGLTAIFAVAPTLNVPSVRVMKKIGMQLDSEFDHPKIDAESPLRRCYLYKISKGD
ncbi:MAG: GNAT family N-acetyltransferase [Bacteroidota bacterium]